MTLPLTPSRIRFTLSFTRLPSCAASSVPALQPLLPCRCFVSHFWLWTLASVSFLSSSFTVLVNDDALPTFSILFSDFRSCSRSKRPKRGHLHPHPRDVCVGPAPAAPAMPSPISMALEHSLCLGGTCGQNLLPQREHFHQIVTNINTKDCKQKQKKKKKGQKPNKANQSKGLSGEEAVVPAKHQAGGHPEVCPPG